MSGEFFSPSLSLRTFFSLSQGALSSVRAMLEREMFGPNGETREVYCLADESLNYCYRAFADFVLGSLLLHFFCVNFIN